MAQIDKSTLMQRAHVIRRNLGVTLSEALKRAWELVRLYMVLKGAQVVYLTYKKVDGSIRKAQATLDLSSATFSAMTFNNRSNAKTFTYWDLQKCDFRCFKVENLISWSL